MKKIYQGSLNECYVTLLDQQTRQKIVFPDIGSAEANFRIGILSVALSGQLAFYHSKVNS